MGRLLRHLFFLEQLAGLHLLLVATKLTLLLQNSLSDQESDQQSDSNGGINRPQPEVPACGGLYVLTSTILNVRQELTQLLPILLEPFENFHPALLSGLARVPCYFAHIPLFTEYWQ
ncbi:MAG: hypothetical protein AAB325_01290 [Pseudomonadota bacterium]